MKPEHIIQQSNIINAVVKQIMEPKSPMNEPWIKALQKTDLRSALVQDRISEIDEIIGCYQRFGTNHSADIARLLAEREQLTGGRIEGGAIVIGGGE